MKKYLLLTWMTLMASASLKAAVGDTTWVQANITNLEWYGNFDTAVSFPTSTTYRKIYMIFTLGKHTCPGYNYACGNYGNPPCAAGQTPWCGDWDYTILNYLMTPAGDTLELARLISPYANAGAPRTPYTWTQNYVYDVTDYANQMKGAATMRLLYSGYSGGFTANVKFAFIEGTPDRNVMKVRRLWTGSYGYNDTTHLDSFDINTHFTAVTDTVPSGTASTDLRFLVTGHGSDANGCCEFASHNYHVMVDSASVATQTIWRDNCGANELYPQSGTWLLQRGNWCPGALVYPNFHTLPGLMPGAGFNVAVQFDPYSGSGGSYTTEGQLIYYGPMNKVFDASLDDIIAPTNDQNHFRENPTSNNPIVHVKNTGATTITSIAFEYGVQGYAPQTYTWSGALDSLQESDISLPLLSALDTVAGISGTYSFSCTMTSINGATDDDATNNTITSSFVAAPVWPSPLKITLRTNNEGANENRWVITDVNNNVVAQRMGAVNNTTYRDTINLPRGCYKLQVFDSSCDGLAWWVFPQYTPPITNGSVSVGPVLGPSLLMQGNPTGSYNNDFGCGFVQYFFLDSMATVARISNVNESNVFMEAYPNPVHGVVNVDISGLQNVQGKIELMDMAGRVVALVSVYDAHTQVNVEQLSGGVYMLVYVNGASGTRAQTKLLIAK